MMDLIGSIILALAAGLIGGLGIGYVYERNRRQDAEARSRDLADDLDLIRTEREELRAELARLNGISQGRECDAMQRKFLETIQQNGQGTVRIARRQEA